MWLAIYGLDWVVGLRSIVCTGDLGLWKRCILWGSFYEITARIYESFGKIDGKVRKARSTSATRDWIRHLSSTSFEDITSQPLMESFYFGKNWQFISMETYDENLFSKRLYSFIHTIAPPFFKVFEDSKKNMKLKNMSNRAWS